MITDKPEVMELINHLQNLVREGFEKKHFEFTVRFSPHSKDRACVFITGGPSKRFILRLEETRE